MALTIATGVNAIPPNDKSADRLRKTYTITGPASYPTGGVTLEAEATLGFGQSVHVLAGNVMRASGGGATIRLVGLNRDSLSALKLQWYDLAGNEIANGTDLSSFSGEIELIGK